MMTLAEARGEIPEVVYLERGCECAHCVLDRHVLAFVAREAAEKIDRLMLETREPDDSAVEDMP